jgi:exodeoxyribonuclease III
MRIEMSKVKIVSWNVNGIRAIGTKEALKWVDNTNIDILCLQEIKALKEQIPEDLFDKKYKETHVNSALKKGYSGVLTWSDLESEFVDTAKHIDLLDEGRILETHHDEFVLFNVYFPNGQASDERLEYKMAFYERFLEYTEALREEGKSIVICGDVNTAHEEIDIKNPKANAKRSGFLPMEREWLDMFLNHGYIDTFRLTHPDEIDRYSWWSYRMKAREKNVGWRIDYFYVSEDLKDNIVSADILDVVMGSDHCPIMLELEF